MTDNTYNGWTTFETWQASLWLSEADTLGRLQADKCQYVDAEDVQSLIYEMLDDIPTTGLIGDIVGSWISCINMHEIADHLNEDLEG